VLNKPDFFAAVTEMWIIKSYTKLL